MKVLFEICYWNCAVRFRGRWMALDVFLWWDLWILFTIKLSTKPKRNRDSCKPSCQPNGNSSSWLNSQTSFNLVMISSMWNISQRRDMKMLRPTLMNERRVVIHDNFVTMLFVHKNVGLVSSSKSSWFYRKFHSILFYSIFSTLYSTSKLPNGTQSHIVK